MPFHGVRTQEQATAVATPVVGQSGVAYFIGRAPLNMAEKPADVGVPIIAYSWDEAVQKLGYSDDWKTFTLCEAMYSQYKLFGVAPVIFCNLVDPAVNKTTAPSEELTPVDHKVTLPGGAIIDSGLQISVPDVGSLTIDVDYSAFYEGDSLVIELLEDGTTYDADTIAAEYNIVDVSAIDAAAVAMAVESVEQCMSRVGIIPDIICAD
jgi:hypothetical protein